MKEFYLNGSSLRSMDKQIYFWVSKLFTAIQNKPWALAGTIEIIRSIKISVDYPKSNGSQQFLLKDNVFDTVNYRNETALMIAAARGCYQIVKILLEAKANPDIANEYGNTAIMFAASHKLDFWTTSESEPYINTIKNLLEAKATLEIKKNSTHPSALYGIVNTKKLELVTLLLQNETNFNVENDYGTPLLHEAIDIGDQAILSLLLQGKANPDIAEVKDCRQTALHRAVFNRNPEIVILLLEAGAKFNPMDIHNKTPLEYAMRKQCKEDEEIAGILIQYQQKEREKIVQSCEEFLLKVLCNIVADYCFGEITIKDQKITPQNLNKSFQVHESKSEITYIDQSNHIHDLTVIFPNNSAGTNLDTLQESKTQDSFHRNPQEDHDFHFLPTHTTLDQNHLNSHSENDISFFQPETLRIEADNPEEETFENFNPKDKLCITTFCHPLVASATIGTLGATGLLITAFTTKDLLSKKAFYPILSAEIILTILIVYLTYNKLSNSKEVTNEQPKNEAAHPTFLANSF